MDPVGFTGSVNGYVEGFAEEIGGQAFSNSSSFDKAVAEAWRDTGPITCSAMPRQSTIIDCTASRCGRRSRLTVRARRGRG